MKRKLPVDSFDDALKLSNNHLGKKKMVLEKIDFFSLLPSELADAIFYDCCLPALKMVQSTNRLYYIRFSPVPKNSWVKGIFAEVFQRRYLFVFGENRKVASFSHKEHLIFDIIRMYIEDHHPDNNPNVGFVVKFTYCIDDNALFTELWKNFVAFKDGKYFLSLVKHMYLREACCNPHHRRIQCICCNTVACVAASKPRGVEELDFCDNCQDCVSHLVYTQDSEYSESSNSDSLYCHEREPDGVHCLHLRKLCEFCKLYFCLHCIHLSRQKLNTFRVCQSCFLAYNENSLLPDCDFLNSERRKETITCFFKFDDDDS